MICRERIGRYIVVGKLNIKHGLESSLKQVVVDRSLSTLKNYILPNINNNIIMS